VVKHMRRVKCTDCSKTFKTKAAMISHRYWRWVKDMRRVKCTGCSKTFKTKAAMISHRHWRWVKELGHRPGIVKIPCVRVG
jgi:uncharacterized membrane protein